MNCGCDQCCHCNATAMLNTGTFRVVSNSVLPFYVELLLLPPKRIWVWAVCTVQCITPFQLYCNYVWFILHPCWCIRWSRPVEADSDVSLHTWPDTSRRPDLKKLFPFPVSWPPFWLPDVGLCKQCHIWVEHGRQFWGSRCNFIFICDTRRGSLYECWFQRIFGFPAAILDSW